MALPYFDLFGNAPNPFANMSVMGATGLTPLEGLTSETLTGMAGAGSGMASNILPGLGIANFLLNPPRGPADATTVGSPTQGGKPIQTQTDPYFPSMVKGGLSGAGAGAGLATIAGLSQPWLWPVIGGAALLGGNQGKK